MAKVGSAARWIFCSLFDILGKGASFLEILGETMANTKADLLQGTLDLLILKSLQHEPMHGFGVAVRIGQMSKAMLTVEQGSLYPALYRLEDQGWIKSEWGISDNNRKAKFYSITKSGRKQLQTEEESWAKLSTAINLVLGVV
jgi:transcriptional regulator